MTDFAAPYDFINSTTADANAVQANWTAIEEFLNLTGVPKVQDGVITEAMLGFTIATQAELDAEASARSTGDTTVQASVDAHIADATAAHAATAISNTPAGNIAATTVQAALNELDSEKATAGSVTTVASDLAAHIADTSDAHDASAISIVDAGANYTATDVEGALAEVHDSLEAVSAGGVADGSITSAKIADGSVTAAKLAVPEISTAFAGTINAPSIAANGNATIYFHSDATSVTTTTYGGNYVSWDSTNKRHKALQAGLYRVTWEFLNYLIPTAGGFAQTEIYLNKNGNIGVGTTIGYKLIYTPVTSGLKVQRLICTDFLVSLAANDYLIGGVKTTLSGSAAVSQFSLNDDGTGSAAFHQNMTFEYLGPAS